MLATAVVLAALACALGAGCAARAARSPTPTPTRPATDRGNAVHAEAADRPLKAALAALAANPSAAHNIDVGNAYMQLGVDDLALRHFEMASRLDPAAAAAWDGQARIWRDWGLPDQGLASAYLAVFHAPASAEAHNTLGTVFQAMEQFDLARQEYATAVTLDPGASWAWNNLCSLTLADGRWNEGLSACQHAVRLDPRSAVARQNLSAIERALGMCRDGCGTQTKGADSRTGPV
jgi:tetratricopeptide (TPR) repeat protein